MDERSRRQMILDEAHRRFMHGGTRKTTMEEIATGVGVTKSALYKHFRDKQEIVLAIIDREIDASFDVCRGALAGSGPLQSRLQAMYDALLDHFFIRVPGRGMTFDVWGEIRPLIMRRQQERHSDHRFLLIGLLNDAVSAGEAVCDVEQVALLVHLTLSAIFDRVMLGEMPPEQAHRFTRTMVDTLINGIRPRGRSAVVRTE